MSISFQVADIRIGTGNLFLIAGPCVIESEKHALFMAEVIKGVTRSLNVPFIFKASYDKANRTSIRSFRGPGLEEGLRILKKVKDEVHVPILTDVHQVGGRGQGRRGRRHSANSGLPLPPNRPGRSCRHVGAGGEHQEGPVRFSLGHAACGGKMPAGGQ